MSLSPQQRTSARLPKLASEKARVVAKKRLAEMDVKLGEVELKLAKVESLNLA